MSNRSRLYNLAIIVAFTTLPASAGWFTTDDQEGREAFARGRYKEAATKFHDPYRKGVAQYRAADYRSAAESFSRVDRDDVLQAARYNLGNARFRLGDYEGAVQAYEAVLQEDPNDRAARHNLALALSMLAQTRANPEPEAPPEEEEQPEEQAEEQQEQESEQQQEPESGQEESEQQQESESGQQESEQQQESESGQQESEQQQES